MTVQRQSSNPIASLRVPLAGIAFAAALTVSFALGAILYGGDTSTTSQPTSGISAAHSRSLPGVGELANAEFVASAFAEHESFMEANFGQPVTYPWAAPVDLAVAQSEHNALIDAELNVGRTSLVQPNNQVVLARAQHDALIDSALNVGRSTVGQFEPGVTDLARSEHDNLIAALGLS